jgi:glycosyltransferase involved in cell wall biosynthesis
MNHHQAPMSDELYKFLGENYKFIQTEPVAEERVSMGWAKDSERPYVLQYQDEPELAQDLIKNSDVVMFGGVDDESYIMSRLEAGKPVLRYTERLYKTGRWKFISPRGLNKKYHDHTRFRRKPVFLLCAGGYVAGDFRLIGAYSHKKYKWGYFPETKEYDIDGLIEQKRELTKQNDGKISILWAGRFIDWKHPEMAILLAERLKKNGCHFQLTMIGGGEMDSELRDMVSEKQLEDCVTFAGYKTPKEVRKYMEDSEIFIFTSDQQEGWGAVLNEAMNSGCACVASHQIGAVPYLIQDYENGMAFRSKDQTELGLKVEMLIDYEDFRRDLAVHAYNTIVSGWNSKNAAEVLIDMCQQIIRGEKPGFRDFGPGSRA